MNILWVSFNFQPNTNVKTTFTKVDVQRSFNADLKLMSLLEKSEPDLNDLIYKLRSQECR